MLRVKINEEYTSQSSLTSFTKYQIILFNLKVFVFKEILLLSSQPLKKAGGEKAQVLFFDLKDTNLNPSRQSSFAFFLSSRERICIFHQLST